MPKDYPKMSKFTEAIHIVISKLIKFRCEATVNNSNMNYGLFISNIIDDLKKMTIDLIIHYTKNEQEYRNIENQYPESEQFIKHIIRRGQDRDASYNYKRIKDIIYIMCGFIDDIIINISDKYNNLHSQQQLEHRFFYSTRISQEFFATVNDQVNNKHDEEICELLFICLILGFQQNAKKYQKQISENITELQKNIQHVDGTPHLISPWIEKSIVKGKPQIFPYKWSLMTGFSVFLFFISLFALIYIGIIWQDAYKLIIRTSELAINALN